MFKFLGAGLAPKFLIRLKFIKPAWLTKFLLRLNLKSRPALPLIFYFGLFMLITIFLSSRYSLAASLMSSFVMAFTALMYSSAV